MLPGFTVSGPAHGAKVTIGRAFSKLCRQLLRIGGEFEEHIVELFREDFGLCRIYRRDLIPFVVDKGESHLGVVKAVATLGLDDRFAVGLPTAYWTFIDNPTHEQIEQTKEEVLQIEIG